VSLQNPLPNKQHKLDPIPFAVPSVCHFSYQIYLQRWPDKMVYGQNGMDRMART